MADKKNLSLSLSAGGSSVPMAGGEEFSPMSCTAKSMGFSLQRCTQAKSMGFSLDPCTQASEEACIGDQSAPKRKKAPTAVLDGCTPKRRGEEVSEEEPWRAVDSQLTVLEGEEGDDSDYEEFMVGLRASFAANVEKMFANSPNVMFVDFPSCCVRPPGVEFPKPCARRPDGQNDANKEDEELGDDAILPVSG